MGDIDKYTIAELEQALSSIDRAAYPERAKKLSDAMEQKSQRAASLEGELNAIKGVQHKPLQAGADFLDFVGSFLCSWGLLIGLLGLAGVFGAGTVTWNGSTVHGFGALFATLFVLAIFAVIVAGGMFLGYLLFNKLRRG
ncbi:hypothetical protein HFP89_11390 [Wenzhouxiangella sp. XN79A]|uniref:hypothetical protein n=1 Tax=Wenzhouxiangella sp. XN79A TaxID=2724193 RepID=UPI00144A5F62|nr:hypothetical protein [Wenzhouxiangella sp. XN79A]NKI35765.1 hypothetical protein [Wenzhouxiangella sp. XN79A]